MSKMPGKPKPTMPFRKGTKPPISRFLILFLGFALFFSIFFSNMGDPNTVKLNYSDFIAYSKGLYTIKDLKNNATNVYQLTEKNEKESIYKIYNNASLSLKISASNKSNYKISTYRTLYKVVTKPLATKLSGTFIDEKGSQVRFVSNIPLISTDFLNKLIENGIYVEITASEQDNGIFNSLIGFLPWALMIFFIWFFFIRQVSNSNNKAFTFGKSKAKLYSTDSKDKVTFADVAGNEEAKRELQEVVDFLKKPEKYLKMGAKIPKGILLSGPPGTGKTLLAKAVAGEADKPFYSIIASEFVEMFVGVGASRVRDLFNTAKKNAPCIIFIDELDAIGRMRGVGIGGGNDEKEQTLNQILSEIDGFEKEATVIVIAATNRPDILDAALLRPGRFDRQIQIENPSETDRLAILKLIIKNKPISKDIDLESIAKEISGFSGAEIANLVNEAILIATRSNKKLVDEEDFKEAHIKVSRQKNHNSTDPPTLFGKSRSRFYDKTTAQTKTFDDVAGAYEAKQELMEVVDFLKNPEKYKKLGARIPKGILLSGPPGTGKTLLAKAVAGESHRPFFSASGSDFVEMYVGVGASRVRDLFNTAKKNAPCIIFIDEIDAIGKQRGGGFGGGGNDERDQTLNQILSEMDGFDSSNTVIVLASTNRADTLDTALLRPGRFDRQVMVENPDVRAREDILKVHALKKPLSDDVDLRKLAHGTSGFSGAELENLLNEAALAAASKNQEVIYWEDIDNAKDKVLMGPEKRNIVMLQKEKINTAYHEAGHAIVAHYLEATDPVYKVTIIPRGKALGVTQQIPIDDKKGYTREYILNRISILMAGRIAEEIKFGADQITTGASSDIKAATQMAHKYVTEFGMTKSLGMINYDSRKYSSSYNYSQETAYKIDEEMKKIIDTQYDVAYNLLKKHADKLIEMSDMLLEKESIDEADVENLLGVKPGIAELKSEVNAEYEKMYQRLQEKKK